MQVMTLMHDGFGRSFVDFLMRPRPQYWLARFYLCCSILLTTAFAWVLPVSAQRQTLMAIGPEAWWVLAGVTIVSILGIVDGVLNDILPDRFHLRWADRRRHQVYMLMALLMWSLVWMHFLHDTAGIVVFRYALDGTLAATVAILDTLARVKQVSRVVRGG